ncbi:unnamed protein product [Arctogadus glacialis]
MTTIQTPPTAPIQEIAILPYAAGSCTRTHTHSHSLTHTNYDSFSAYLCLGGGGWGVVAPPPLSYWSALNRMFRATWRHQNPSPPSLPHKLSPSWGGDVIVLIYYRFPLMIQCCY